MESRVGRQLVDGKDRRRKDRDVTKGRKRGRKASKVSASLILKSPQRAEHVVCYMLCAMYFIYI